MALDLLSARSLLALWTLCLFWSISRLLVSSCSILWSYFCSLLRMPCSICWRWRSSLVWVFWTFSTFLLRASIRCLNCYIYHRNSLTWNRFSNYLHSSGYSKPSWSSHPSFCLRFLTGWQGTCSSQCCYCKSDLDVSCACQSSHSGPFGCGFVWKI